MIINKMTFDIEEIKRIGLEALKAAYYKQIELSNAGTIGERIPKKNLGGDTSLRGDIESEDAVIETFQRNNFPAIIYAEEHGIVKLVNRPTIFSSCDGFDGSSTLANDNKARGGTMLSVTDNLNPRYKDILFSGITDFSTGRIVYGVKDEGVFLISNVGNNKKVTKLEKFPVKKFDSNLKIHLDDPDYWGSYTKGITALLDQIGGTVRENFTKKLVEKVQLSGLNSSGAMCLDLLVGDVDAIAGIRAKGDYEVIVEYLLTTLLGGVVIGLDGKDIGNHRWLEDRERYRTNPIPTLRASSPQLAKEIISHLNSC